MRQLIIGNMTGNSMDAIDLVLTEFDDNKITDICTYTQPYDKEMQDNMERLRQIVKNKTPVEIEALPLFNSVHDTYIRQIADAINEMLSTNKIEKSEIRAIGFHGKTLDHFPPSMANQINKEPYTLQIGSGEMLADLTGIPVVYDFRSAFIMNGFDGAPLIPPHNAHIAAIEGDGCYYNGGNTSNFAWIINGEVMLASDAGPFNEYVDNFVRCYSSESYDKDSKFGKLGKLDHNLLQKLFDKGKIFYRTPLPKSGDPQYYGKDKIFQMIENHYSIEDNFCNIVHTLEYFSAYIAVFALTMTENQLELPANFVLFGGGWKNPITIQAFTDLLSGKGYVLPEHQKMFNNFIQRFKTKAKVQYSKFGTYMEARLFADLARYKLENKAWEIPEVKAAGKKIVCGIVAEPKKNRSIYTDKCNLAAKGWRHRVVGN